MSVKGSFTSRKALVLYLALAMTTGFGLAVGVLALNGSWVPQIKVMAEENPVVVPNSLYEAQNTFRAITKAVLPAIVEIKTEGPVAAQGQEQQTVPPCDFFFGPQNPNDSQNSPQGKVKPPKAPKAQGLGSGVMVERQGDKVYILTNNHVIEQSDKIKVKLSDKREYDGILVGTDPRRDLALVSITTKENDLVLAKLGNSDDLQVGDWVLAMGNPMGLDFSVTHGIVSALGRQGGPDDSVNINNYIQTDASINRGNSGGALINLKGEVIGINTWIVSPSGGSAGLGFAIPINSTKRAIADFISNGAVRYGWLGASVTNVTKELADDLKLPTTKGSFIPHVYRDSPAEKAGILPGDVVTGINGNPIQDMNQLVQTVGDLAPGQSASFDVFRDGKTMKKTVVIEPRGKESEMSGRKLWPGFVVTPLTADIRDQMDLAPSLEGLVVINVEAKSTGDIAGLKLYDVLKSINGKPVRSIADFYHTLNDQSGEVKLTFVREGVELSISVTR